MPKTIKHKIQKLINLDHTGYVGKLWNLKPSAHGRVSRNLFRSAALSHQDEGFTRQKQQFWIILTSPTSCMSLWCQKKETLWFRSIWIWKPLLPATKIKVGQALCQFFSSQWTVISRWQGQCDAAPGRNGKTFRYVGERRGKRKIENIVHSQQVQPGPTRSNLVVTNPLVVLFEVVVKQLRELLEGILHVACHMQHPCLDQSQLVLV